MMVTRRGRKNQSRKAFDADNQRNTDSRFEILKETEVVKDQANESLPPKIVIQKAMEPQNTRVTNQTCT